MVLNIACAILIVLGVLYVALSVFTLIHYILFKDAKIIEIFVTCSFLTICIVLLIVIIFSSFPSINLEFTL
jgi:hypothetical protein